MAALENAPFIVKYNDASTGLFKANTTQNRSTLQDRTLIQDLTDSFLNKADGTDIYKTFAITASGTDTYTATPSPAITAYTTNHHFYVTFTNANTGAATLNLATLGAKAIKKNSGVALAAGDISAGQILLLVYDGTNFQVVGGSGGGNRFIGTHDASGNTLPSTNLTPGNEWYISVTGSLDPGDGSGSQVVVVGTIIKFISTGLWRFIQ
jgi:hypothetical protein